MNINVGIADRTIRIWLGIGMVLFAYMRPDLPYAFIGWLGVIPLATGLFGWCGIYKLFGITTVKNAK
ncbi:MAG: DUF2892 domain-containing protein [Rhizobiaceae bacterium]|nr:DUF2892 domain-containing protein [Rhizobiaceae bacterium]